MSYEIKILPVAREDIKDCIKWYNEQKSGLGKLFYTAVKARIVYIKGNPLHYQIKYRDIRHAQINKFPFLVHYKIEENNKKVVIFGVTHMSRNPKVWQSRG